MARFTYGNAASGPEGSGGSMFGGSAAPADLMNLIHSSLYAAGMDTRDANLINKVLQNVDSSRFYSNRRDPTVINQALVKAGLPATNAQLLKSYTSQPALNRGHAWKPQDVAQHHIDATRDLAKNPGVLQLAGVMAGGAALGSAYGGTAATAAPAASTTASSVPGGALYSTPGTLGTNAFGGAYSTPAMTTYAGAGGTAVGGTTAPATLGAGSVGLAGGGATLTGGAGVGSGTPGATTGAATTGAATTGATTGAATAGSKIVGALSNPMVLGTLGGAVLGGAGGSEQTGTYKVEEGLPDWLMPYAKPTLDRYATDIANYEVDPYGVLPSAMQEFQRTIGGEYLDPSSNKYLEDYFRLGAERIKGSLSPSFGHMQAFGGHSGYNEALSRGLGDFSVGLYGGAYEKERDRQAQFTGAAPQFLANSSTAAFAPYQQYLTTIGSLGSSKKQPLFENTWGNVLGGAMAGGTLGSMWNWGKK